MLIGKFMEQYEDELDFNLSILEMDILIGSILNKREQPALNKHVGKRHKEIVEKMGYWDFYAILQEEYD